MGCTPSTSMSVPMLANQPRQRSTNHLLVEALPFNTSLSSSLSGQTAGLPSWSRATLANKYRILDSLGAGAYANVLRAEDQETGETVAIKIAKTRRCKKSLSEIQILLVLDAADENPHVLPIINAVLVDRVPHLVMPFSTRGDVFSYLEEQDCQLVEAEVQHLMHGIAKGLDFCHQRGVAHLDLKPENVVLVDATSLADVRGFDGASLVGPHAHRHPCYPQLIDFGEAVAFDGDTVCDQLAGSPDYLAPEVLRNRYHPAKADCWSLGITLYVLLTGTLPFSAPTTELIEQRVREYVGPLPAGLTKRVSNASLSALLGLVRRDMHSRLSCAQFLAHPWMQDYCRPGSEVQLDYERYLGHVQTAIEAKAAAFFPGQGDIQRAYTSSHVVLPTVTIPVGSDLVFQLPERDRSTVI